jgi:hypothetical protein
MAYGRVDWERCPLAGAVSMTWACCYANIRDPSIGSAPLRRKPCGGPGLAGPIAWPMGITDSPFPPSARITDGGQRSVTTGPHSLGDG